MSIKILVMTLKKKMALYDKMQMVQNVSAGKIWSMQLINTWLKLHRMHMRLFASRRCCSAAMHSLPWQPRLRCRLLICRGLNSRLWRQKVHSPSFLLRLWVQSVTQTVGNKKWILEKGGIKNQNQRCTLWCVCSLYLCVQDGHNSVFGFPHVLSLPTHLDVRICRK